MTNTKELDELMKQLETLVEDLSNSIIEEVGPDITKELQSTHRKEQDPNGNPWKDRKKAYDHPINMDTGKLFNSYTSKPNKNNKTLSIQNTAAYAEYVNNVRPILPSDDSPSSDIPDKWMERIEESVEEFIKEFQKK